MASGRKSDFYFNLKPTMLDPEGAALLAELTYEGAEGRQARFCRRAGDGRSPTGGCDRATLLDRRARSPPSCAQKAEGARRPSRGGGARPRGETLQGKRIVIVEDVTTTGGSALKAVEAVREAGGEIVLVLTMVDREEGATETFAEAGLEFRSLYKATEF